MAVVTIRIDDAVKRQAEDIFKKLGLSFSAGVNAYLHQVIDKKGIPFVLDVSDRGVSILDKLKVHKD
ncbi:MAG: type II toxin-antitoxin system RelB/DinJ family antitoxin [Fibromonadaceae bacterium]|jgi:DNA-damage-inducible protein J|nr:type II toxin-antitoxin system RelB/DinJ family antitoxin [Fibromonadaceae bacterium]